MAYGIDDTIQQKVDAYRGNPAALQRRYAQNRQLIDLLALQKLKSEKDAAARDMQMKMQQQPQTLVQQYEAELAGRTKNEILTGVAGVMQQRQAQQQRNMQQMANRPRPVKPMAQGGIVGLAAGGTPQDNLDKISEIRKKVAEGKLTAAEGQDQIDKIIPRTAAGEVPVKGAATRDMGLAGKIVDALGGASGVADAEAAERQRVGIVTNRAADQQSFDTPGASRADPSLVGYNQADLAASMTPPGAPASGGDTPPAAPPAGDETPPSQEPESDPLMDAVGKIGSGGLTDRTITVPGSNVGNLNAADYKTDMTEANRIRGGLENVYRDFMESDPETMAAERRDAALDFLSLSPEDQEIRDRIITERKAQENEVAGIEKLRYGDPKKLRRERLISNLIGAQGTTIGSTLATGAGASIVKGAQQEAGIDKLRGERFGLQDKRLVAEGANVTERQNIKSKAFDAGQEGYKQGYEQIRAGAAGISDLGNQAQSFAENEANKLLQVDKANLTADTANRQMELRASIETAKIASENDLAKFRAGIVRDTKIIEAIMAREKNALTAETNEIMRTGNTIKMQGVAGRISAVIATVAKQYQDAYAPLIQFAQMNEDSSPSAEELKVAMEEAIKQSTTDLTKMLDNINANIAGGLPGQTAAGSTDGFTVS